ncbi:GGDEF domain-containing protein [Lactobacillus delbrueckii]|uniref:GGDEF domain-containing protein n=1 Tax=Lactobacillus delbrueckii TaxID=1584 RepID=UPI0039953DB2
MTKLLVFLFCLLLYAYSIWTTLQNPSSQATTIMVFLVLLPTIFVITPWKQFLMSFILVICFNYLVIEFKTPDSFDADSWNSVFFGVVGIISGYYFDHVSLLGWLDAEKSKFLSENDLLTGIRNRNYYQDEIGNLLHGAQESVTFVFCDVNGLHETNNKLGHEAGDRMLIALASELADKFGQDMSFRFGGDEFLAIALDEPLDQVQAKSDQILSNLKKQGYHVSIGIKQANADHLNVTDLLYQADKAMRKSKEEFYKKAENDRRVR